MTTTMVTPVIFPPLQTISLDDATKVQYEWEARHLELAATLRSAEAPESMLVAHAAAVVLSAPADRAASALLPAQHVAVWRRDG